MNWNNLTIGRKIGIGFGFIILIIITIGFTSYSVTSKGIKVTNSAIEKGIPYIKIAHELKILALQHRRYEKDFFLNIGNQEKQKGYLKKFDKVANEIRNKMTKLKELISKTADSEKEIELINKASDAYEQYHTNFLKLAERVLNDSSITPQKGNKLMSPFKKQIYAFESSIQVIVDHSVEYTKKHLNKFSSDSLMLILVVIAIGVIASIILSITVTSNVKNILILIIQKLSESVLQLSSTSTQLTSSSQQLSEGASRQASILEETSNSMELFTSQTKENAENALSVASSIEQVATMVKQSTENAKDAVKISEDAKMSAKGGAEAMASITKAMKEIREGSNKINDIIQVINEITNKTKMLSLNAAIEAARAGDQGKGFSVVADEVSKLAENSRRAAEEIASLIKDSTGKAQNGSDIAEKGEEVLNDILTRASKVSDLISEISDSTIDEVRQVEEVEHSLGCIRNSSNEQLNNVEQVKQTIVDINKITQSNNANAKDAADTSEQLFSQAQTLQKLVEELSFYIGLKDSQQSIFQKEE